METSNKNTGKQQESILDNMWSTIAAWFKPEEVEVTFKEDVSGHVISYSYTVVDHPQKQVA